MPLQNDYYSASDILEKSLWRAMNLVSLVIDDDNDDRKIQVTEL
jgi:hypothetical protein